MPSKDSDQVDQPNCAELLRSRVYFLTVPLTLIALLLGLGLFVGALSGLLGIGGGLLMVPVLTAVGFGVLPATATSLVGVMFSSISGSLRNWRTGKLDLRRSLGLASSGIPTAQIGAMLAEHLSPSVLAFAFAGLQVVAMYLIGVRQRLALRDGEGDDRESGHEGGYGGDRLGDRPYALWLDRSSLGIGMIAGVLSGLFGVGGGVIMVPLQMLVLKTPIKEAVRVSLGAIVAIGASGLIRHAFLGNVLWIPGLCLGIGGVIGAQIGVRLLPYLSAPFISFLFRGLLMLMAAFMVYEGWILLPST
ncbi:MAG: sulfite exporter TauE/SafE family protein [Coleofasciculaceae cyanobacterium RL_1_1]|nr:sulfite exporter TauE/SafE family protein [Coleofasciculaceae cyanobacterium RL_1_1]